MARRDGEQSLRGVIRSLGPLRRVLLINPPVHETNYRWLHWNQPLDLLKIGALLRSELGVDVKLFDFLVPDKGGRTPKHKLEDWKIHGLDVDAWHFGQPIDHFRKAVKKWTKESWIPDAIVISTLTSYWIAGLNTLLFAIRNLSGAYTDVPIVLYGNLPRISPEAAGKTPCVTHTAVGEKDPIEIPAALDLYRELGAEAQFCALDARNPRLADEVKHQIEQGYTSFTFFNDDIFDAESHIIELAASGVVQSKKIGFDIICGARPSQLSVERLNTLEALNVRTMCVDYEVDLKGELLAAEYERIRDHSLRGGFLRRPGVMSGFVDFGRPDENFERVVYHTLVINKWLGGIILKPFGVLWEITNEPDRQRQWERPEDQSPHAFPYLARNNASVEDYLSLYRWQAMLNYRNRGATFDFLSDTLLGHTVRQSIRRESWTIDNIIKEGERDAKRKPAHGITLPTPNL